MTSPTPDEHPSDRTGNWIVGSVVIVLGLLFLIGNLTGLALENWWSLVLLIPLGSLAVKLWQSARRDGFPNGGLIVGFLGILTVMIFFLFAIDWTVGWPVFLLIGGIAILLGTHRSHPP